MSRAEVVVAWTGTVAAREGNRGDGTHRWEDLAVIAQQGEMVTPRTSLWGQHSLGEPWSWAPRERAWLLVSVRVAQYLAPWPWATTGRVTESASYGNSVCAGVPGATCLVVPAVPEPPVPSYCRHHFETCDGAAHHEVALTGFLPLSSPSIPGLFEIFAT